MGIPTISGLFQNFHDGFRMLDGMDLRRMRDLLFGARTGIVAAAGGGQINATQLAGSASSALFSVDTVVTAGDSVMLPPALQGRQLVIKNNTGNSMNVFAQPANSALNPPGPDQLVLHGTTAVLAAGASVAQPGASVGEYFCFTPGVWTQSLNT